MDSEIYDVIEKKNQQLITTVASMISGYTASITTLVTMENQGIKKSIDGLTATVKEQNGSIRNLKEWKAEIEGEEKGEAKIEERQIIADNLKATQKRDHWQRFFLIVMAILIMIGIGVSIVIGVKTIKQNRTTKESVETTNNKLDLMDNSGLIRAYQEIKKEGIMKNDTIK
jgi:5-enolpyruvylshikimate-3-phosphate synthase